MTLALALKLMIVLSVILMLFAISLRARASDLGYLFTHWRLGLGALVAMFVIAPAVAIVISYVFDLNPAVEIALVTIALSPIPPILPNKQVKAGGRACYVTGLLFGATIVAIFAAPLGVHLASRIFGFEGEIGFMAVAIPLIVTILLPLILGVAVAPLLKEGPLSKLSAIASKAGVVLLVVAAVGLLIMIFPRMLEVIGHGTLLALAVMAIVGLIAGYLFGGSDPAIAPPSRLRARRAIRAWRSPSRLRFFRTTSSHPLRYFFRFWSRRLFAYHSCGRSENTSALPPGLRSDAQPKPF